MALGSGPLGQNGTEQATNEQKIPNPESRRLKGVREERNWKIMLKCKG